MKPPQGLEGVIDAFGDPYAAMGDDGILQPPERAEWESRLVMVPLPRPLPLAWAPMTRATRIRCHQAVADVFRSVFRTLDSDDELWRHLKTYGGCYEFRTKRRAGDELSLHSWGVAIDLNPGTNRMGTEGDMHPSVVQVFEAHGFVWGGRWRNQSCDPMHFQMAAGV